MSDVGVSLTVPIVLAVLVLAYWPVGLVLALGLVVGALMLKGIGRWLCVSLAVAAAAAYIAAVIEIWGVNSPRILYPPPRWPSVTRQSPQVSGRRI